MLVESPRQIGLVLERPELPTRSVNLVQDQSLLIRNIKVHPRKISEASVNNSLQADNSLHRDLSRSIFVKSYIIGFLAICPEANSCLSRSRKKTYPSSQK